MAVVKRADADVLARSAILLDLGDLRRQAAEFEERTRLRASQILDETRRERDRIMLGAAEQGHTQGHAAGLAQGLEEGRRLGRDQALAQTATQAQGLRQACESALSDFLARRDQMLEQARADVLALALDIARRVIKRTVEVDPAVVTSQLEAALALVISPSALVIAVHPQDAQLAAAIAPAIAERLVGSAHLRVREDPALSRGSVVISTAGGQVDASIDTQIARIVDAIAPHTPATDTSAANNPAAPLAPAPQEPAP